MAAWDGTFDPAPPVDNVTLLRILESAEATLTAPTLSDSAYMAQAKTRVLRDPEYDILRENDMLRNALIDFLRADWSVQTAQRELKKMDQQLRHRVTRFMFARNKRKNLEAGIKRFEVDREAVFKKYEMLRRLAAYDNKLLNRYKS
jgi:hypothetical protein